MKKIVFFMLVGGFIFFITGIACAQSEEEYAILEKVNRERMVRNLRPLSWDGQLAKIARKYSKEMARTGNFSHYDNNGNSVIERVNEGGFTGWRRIGENLFFAVDISGSDLAVFAVEGWMRSSSHRKNILLSEWRLTGIGVFKAKGRVYVTQIFADRGRY
jgi:uncharacterized protein YkwD